MMHDIWHTVYLCFLFVKDNFSSFVSDLYSYYQILFQIALNYAKLSLVSNVRRILSISWHETSWHLTVYVVSLCFQTLLKEEKTILKKKTVQDQEKKLHSSIFCISGVAVVFNQ